MANLYELLMARERGNIQDAPNKQRIGQAPLNLRSAMRYAVGGLTDADISAYVQANIGNPAAISEAAQQYQVTAEDLARATGYSPQEVKTYFASAGVSGPYREPETREKPVPSMPSEYRDRPLPMPDYPPMPPQDHMYRPYPMPDYPPMPPVYPPNYEDPGFTPMPPVYPPTYQDIRSGGHPVRTTPQPPSSGLLGSLGYGLGSGQSNTGQSMGVLGAGLGAGLPGQGMQSQEQMAAAQARMDAAKVTQDQTARPDIRSGGHPVRTTPQPPMQGAGIGQSLDSLINYLATPRKS